MAEGKVRSIRIAAETGSTNADLLDALRSSERVPEGEWLVTDRQTAGRGRQGRDWFDGAGNFMGSTVVRPGPNDPPAHTLALLAGLALYEAVTPMCSDPSAVSLKWPNDLLLGGAKLAGILLEREGDAVVLGFGVNLAKAPDVPDRETIALSALGPAPSRDLFARDLAISLDKELERWRSYGLEPTLRRWCAAAHAVGTPLSVHEPDGTICEGAFKGLDAEGALQITLAGGTVRTIHAGDVLHAKET
ncbi:biotin--[acetyl-CoA-carboxylase] ligase [Qipengyuania sp. DSG2-2]|uniref:biotin--[acetyl-CoA-carboxylase] ligase n=1 Tax=Qipengyuania sp. DGS2-2 TaxID=3349631 RepID=UPI0036D3F445